MCAEVFWWCRCESVRDIPETCATHTVRDMPETCLLVSPWLLINTETPIIEGYILPEDVEVRRCTDNIEVLTL